MLKTNNFYENGKAKKKHTTTPAQKEGGDQCPLQWTIIHLKQASVAGQLPHSLLN
jgi:hypothetical protein